MALLTRAMIATILMSVLEENSVKMEKGWGKKKNKKKSSFQSLREHKIWRHSQKTYRNVVISKLYTLKRWNGCQL